MSTVALNGLLDYLYGTLTPDNMRWVGELPSGILAESRKNRLNRQSRNL